MKLVLVAVVVLGFLYVGIGISLYYKKRNTFFCGLKNFCDKIRADINFSNKSLIDIIDCSTPNHQTKKLLDNFSRYLLDKSVTLDKHSLFGGIGYLDEREQDLILDFFTRLGRHDVENEIKLIDDFTTVVDGVYDGCQKQLAKEGKLALKLSFLIGLMIAVVLI